MKGNALSIRMVLAQEASEWRAVLISPHLPRLTTLCQIRRYLEQ